MRIQFENVDLNSRSGPNGFGLKLARQFMRDGHELTNDQPDVRLSFIQSMNNFKPTVLRLDGIYFNSLQDWEAMNEPIRRSYEHAQAVVVQSEFDKKLIFKFFGERNNVHVIHNGTDTKLIQSIQAQDFNRENTWMCASSWRPHKRLDENIRLFQHLKKEGDSLLVAGSNAHVSEETNVDGVHFLGDLNWESMISCMKASANFIHLSWLDHCPNVVVDAKAAGCRLHVSEAGGTAELTSSSDLVYKDAPFNFDPVELYNPPNMVFNSRQGSQSRGDVSISVCSKQYLKVLRGLI
ncbi:MAG: hypothetical protein CMA72_09600 [Euryarchaeota archaeon]|nr:hypothetical protein [Euryarchaeota archaeon]|tara:strand:- start:1467 stop:2348 length:882 start_codon:yes stop_codon:yes gene_type:complete